MRYVYTTDVLFYLMCFAPAVSTHRIFVLSLLIWLIQVTTGDTQHCHYINLLFRPYDLSVIDTILDAILSYSRI